MAQAATPTEIRISKDRRSVSVTWPPAQREVFDAEMLRVLSPSAEVQGHSPEQKVTVGGKRSVAIADVVPVGHYAVRIVFDDGHDSGIFTWAYLSTLARERDDRWREYLNELSAKGLTR